MEANVTQALHNNALSIEATLERCTFDVQWLTEKFAQCKLNSPARCFHSSSNSRLVDGLARHTSQRIDFRRVQPLVLVGYPSHLPCRRAHIRRGNILTWMDKITLNQLVGKSTGYLLYLMLIVIIRIYAQPPF